jgi:alanine racemase
VSLSAQITIDLDAAIHNLEIVRDFSPKSKVMAIVKADAYGHGALRIVRSLKEADAFGVARLDEAVALRDAGYENRIVLLEGPVDYFELNQAFDLKLDIVLHSAYQIDLLARQNTQFRVWLKINTGMNRLGFRPKDVLTHLSEIRKYATEIICMTHFSCTKLSDIKQVGLQEECFNSVAREIGGEGSLANSAAILTLPSTHKEWVRPGLMLYGVSPFFGKTGRTYGLKPVMTLKSRLISVQTVSAGQYVGYGRNYLCKKDTRIGVVAFGYGDGYPRTTHASVIIRGIKARVVGDCSMDMITIDLGSVPRARCGDEVTLWGDGLPVEEVAESSGMIPYELLCRVKMRAKYVESS